MPYFRRRKYYKRTRRLTKSNILANRSARAQSKQIVALSRKVNILAKANKPEILTAWKTFERTFTNSALASNYDVTWSIHPWLDMSGKSFNDSLQGNFCHSKSYTFDAIVEYSDSWSGNVAASENHQRTASYRLVIVQYRNSQNQSQPSQSEIFDSIFNVGSTTASSDYNVTLPLKSGITAQYKILYSKVYTISNEHPIKHIVINIPGKKLLNFNRELLAGASSLSTYPRGMIRACLLTGGLHSDADYNSQIIVSATCKIAFTDN